MTEMPPAPAHMDTHQHASERESRWNREERVDVMVKVLIWAMIATVAAIAFAVGLFIARQLTGAIESLAIPIVFILVGWVAWLHHKLRGLERRMDLEIL